MTAFGVPALMETEEGIRSWAEEEEELLAGLTMGEKVEEGSQN